MLYLARNGAALGMSRPGWTGSESGTRVLLLTTAPAPERSEMEAARICLRRVLSSRACMGREQVESASEMVVVPSVSLSLSRTRSRRLISSRLSGAGARAGGGPCLDAGAEGEEEGGSGFGSCGVDEVFVGIVVFEVDVLRQRKLIGLLAEGRRESLLVDAC